MKTMNPLLIYRLLKTTQRLTFDILEQAPEVTFKGDDDGEYFKFTASNGYEVISRSRMDIQTERLWLLGAKSFYERRSGSMVFSSNAERDAAYLGFFQAINEWAAHHGGVAVDADSPDAMVQPVARHAQGKENAETLPSSVRKLKESASVTATAAGYPLDAETDPMYADALALVSKFRKPSISLVQRHLKIGYNRAARLLERMEEERIVSPMGRDGLRAMLEGGAA